MNELINTKPMIPENQQHEKHSEANPKVGRSFQPKKHMLKYFWVKVAVLLIVELLCIGGIFKINTDMMARAEEIKKLRATHIGSETGNQKEILEGELSKNKTKIDELKAYFPTDDALLDIILELDEMKKAGLITKFDFVSNDVVKDSNGLTGIPILLTMKGNKDSVNQALERLEELKIIIRPVTAVLSLEATSSATLNVEYGGVIYVDEQFGKN